MRAFDIYVREIFFRIRDLFPEAKHGELFNRLYTFYCVHNWYHMTDSERERFIHLQIQTEGEGKQGLVFTNGNMSLVDPDDFVTFSSEKSRPEVDPNVPNAQGDSQE